NQIKKLTKKSSDKGLNQKEKQKLTDAQTEFKSKRKDVQEKLIKFSTRIPVFMYLTDYREQTLRDVITKIESDLFKKVTGLKISDFELLTNIGVFNSALRNDAVYKFRRYEDASLEYAGGMDKHNSDNIGLYDTVIKKDTPIFVSEN
ncbi:MAG: hypothetical protein LBN20_00710, partial [Endomicrobium sp.]|nr:hypothetical protein [Endomicrobium sp.]